MGLVPDEFAFHRARGLWTQVQFTELACERGRREFSGGEETPSWKIREGFLGKGVTGSGFEGYIRHGDTDLQREELREAEASGTKTRVGKGVLLCTESGKGRS